MDEGCAAVIFREADISPSPYDVVDEQPSSYDLKRHSGNADAEILTCHEEIALHSPLSQCPQGLIAEYDSREHGYGGPVETHSDRSRHDCEERRLEHDGRKG